MQTWRVFAELVTNDNTYVQASLESEYKYNLLIRLSRISTSGMEWWNGTLKWNAGMI